MKFTEAQLENVFIELLGNEGVPHVLGNTIARQQNEVLIKADIKSYLQSQYKSDNITDNEIKSVIRKLEVFSASDLYESNKQIMKLVCNGFQLEREDRSKKTYTFIL